MSRLTGNDAKGLMEAYSAVYAPQEEIELTEEQVWEEVENWVSSLLEEGYDLSDYTWEEMYESYLEEQNPNGRPRTGQNPNVWRPTSSTSKPAGGGMGGGRSGGSSPGSIRPSQSSTSAPRPATPTAPRPATPTAPRPATPTAPRPATPTAPRPAGTSKVTPTKPSTSVKPAIGMLGKTSFERRTPTSSELKAAQAARASGASPEKALQAAKAAGGALSQATAAASKPTAFNPTSTTAKTTPTPTSKPTPRQARLNMEMGYDAYDLVLEYLFSQGHTDTIEEANYIMLEMDAEMVQNIVETCLDEAVKGAQRSIANRITGNDIRKVTRGNEDVYKKPKSNDDIENKVSRGSQLRKKGETENMNDRRDRERIEANRKSIQRLNAKPGEDDGRYDDGYYGDDDTSDGKRHYSLSHTNRDARRRRASGR